MRVVVEVLALLIFGIWTYAGVRAVLARDAFAEAQLVQLRRYWGVDWPDRPHFRRIWTGFWAPGCAWAILLVGVAGLAATALLLRAA